MAADPLTWTAASQDGGIGCYGGKGAPSGGSNSCENDVASGRNGSKAAASPDGGTGGDALCGDDGVPKVFIDWLDHLVEINSVDEAEQVGLNKPSDADPLAGMADSKGAPSSGISSGENECSKVVSPCALLARARVTSCNMPVPSPTTAPPAPKRQKVMYGPETPISKLDPQADQWVDSDRP